GSSFNVTAGTASSLAIAGGDAQAATVNTAVAVPPSVRLTDANGNVVAGAAVTFTPASGSGSDAPTTPVTSNSQGIATLASWTLGTTAGGQSLTASAAGVASAVFHATAQAGAPAQLVIVTQPPATAQSGV